jgi:GTP-binding protein
MRPAIIVANKIDIPCAVDHLQRLKEAVENRQEIFPVSAATGEGLKALMYRIAQLLPDIPVPKILNPPVAHLVTKAQPDKRFEIIKENDLFIITGKEIEKHVQMTFFEQEAGVHRFQNILKAMGINEALRTQGIKEGDKVEIAGVRFDWVED